MVQTGDRRNTRATADIHIDERRGIAHAVGLDLMRAGKFSLGAHQAQMFRLLEPARQTRDRMLDDLVLARLDLLHVERDCDGASELNPEARRVSHDMSSTRTGDQRLGRRAAIV